MSELAEDSSTGHNLGFARERTSNNRFRARAAILTRWNPVPRRRQWSLLSENYQRRLLGAGISREDYEDGANLKKARGHSKTPENKRERVKKLAEKLFQK